MENGKTLAEARAELQRGIENVEVACGIPTMMQGYNLEDVASGIDEVMIRQPLGVTAAILMTLGGVDALQSAAVVTGGPFAFVCLLAMIGLIKEFSANHGRVLLQDDATIIGSWPATRKRKTDAPPSDDD